METTVLSCVLFPVKFKDIEFSAEEVSDENETSLSATSLAAWAEDKGNETSGTWRWILPILSLGILDKQSKTRCWVATLTPSEIVSLAYQNNKVSNSIITGLLFFLKL